MSIFGCYVNEYTLCRLEISKTLELYLNKNHITATKSI